MKNLMEVDRMINSGGDAGRVETAAGRIRRDLISRASQIALRLLSRADRRLHDSSLYDLTLDDPYKGLGEVQSCGRILRSWTYQGWLVTGYQQVEELLRHKNMSNDLRSNRFMVRLIKSAVGDVRVPIIDDPTMLNRDPPDHTRLRKLVSRAFNYKFIQSLAPKIEATCQRLLGQLDGGSFDLVSQVAKPLPAIVIAEMLGVPESDYGKFHQWSADLLSITRIDQPAMMRRAARATEGMNHYFAALAQGKRQRPGQDLISELLRVEEEGDRLSLSELYSLCILILVAGHETTSRLIGNGMLLLLQHPGQLAMLRDNPALMDNAIEEMLRYHPPLQFTPRLVKQDFDYQGCRLKRGQATLLSIAGANRDPLVNDKPHEFNIERQSVKHVTFGSGPHLCLGMSLARLEAKIVLQHLLERFPRLGLIDEKPDWQRDFFFRGLRSLRLDTSVDTNTPGKFYD